MFYIKQLLYFLLNSHERSFVVDVLIWDVVGKHYLDELLNYLPLKF